MLQTFHRAPQEVVQARYERAKRLWAARMRLSEISADLGVDGNVIRLWARASPEDFPERGVIVDKVWDKSKTYEVSTTLMERLRTAYLPLADAAPAPLDKTDGCSWPTYSTPQDPFTTQEPMQCCNRTRLRVKQNGQMVTKPYCEVHYRVAYPATGSSSR